MPESVTKAQPLTGGSTKGLEPFPTKGYAASRRGFSRRLANLRGMKVTKRLVVLSAAAVILLQATAGAGVRVEQTADAVFFLPSGDASRQRAIFVQVTQMDGGLYTGFTLERSICDTRGDHLECEDSPRASISGRLAPGDVFEIDAALSSAYLKVKRQGVTHVVRWRAVDDPVPTQADPGCTVPTAAGVEREAVAAGKIFGHRVRPSEVSRASVSAWGYAC